MFRPHVSLYPEIVLATRNRGKVAEIAALLADLNVPVRSLEDFPEVPPLPEEGETFQENAVSKALTVARITGRVAIADDSGLEVDALGGIPGVHSSRFLGEEATDADRNARILELLRGVPSSQRTARFRAVVAVALPSGEVYTFEGVVEGRIAEEPRGEHGFGYDPIFLLPGYGKTFAELGPEVKNRLSHRAQAVSAAREFLRQLFQGSPPDTGP